MYLYDMASESFLRRLATLIGFKDPGDHREDQKRNRTRSCTWGVVACFARPIARERLAYPPDVNATGAGHR